MTVVVTGAAGQLGQDVMTALAARGHEAIGIDRAEADITNEAQVTAVITAAAPDAVIHCAAYTAVDRAEEEKDLCTRINVDGTRFIARAAQQCGAKLVYISTDYVFNGQGEKPFLPTDEKAPLNHYGLTKSQGEDAALEECDRTFVVRTSWVFGAHGNNFIKTMRRLGTERDEVSVVCDEVGAPTYTPDLAALLCEMIESDRYGVYHGTNEGVCRRDELAQAVMDTFGLSCRVNAITGDQYPTLATRPHNSRLSKECLSAAGFTRLPDWKDALARYAKEVG